MIARSWWDGWAQWSGFADASRPVTRSVGAPGPIDNSSIIGMWYTSSSETCVWSFPSSMSFMNGPLLYDFPLDKKIVKISKSIS